jgi:hypothetical protein
MTRTGGIALVALVIGCAAGVIGQQIVFPAHAAPGHTYDFKIVQLRDLVATVKAQNPQFKDADARTALEEGMRGFGRAGFRYAGCLQDSTLGWGSGACSVLIFEQAEGGSALPPPMTPQAAPTPDSSHH